MLNEGLFYKSSVAGRSNDVVYDGLTNILLVPLGKSPLYLIAGKNDLQLHADH